MSKTKEIALISIFSAVCIASRVLLQFLPNIKPVTSLIILVSFYYGWRFGVKTALCTTLISNMILGMGIGTLFQVLAWSVIAVVAGLIGELPLKHKTLILWLFSFVAGYLFGFLVSFEKLFYGGWLAYWVYYLSGLLFDTLHAVGNLVFFPVCRFALEKAMGVKEYS